MATGKKPAHEASKLLKKPTTPAKPKRWRHPTWLSASRPKKASESASPMKDLLTLVAWFLVYGVVLIVGVGITGLVLATSWNWFIAPIAGLRLHDCER